MEAILNFINDTGFVMFFQSGGWKNMVMPVSYTHLRAHET